MAVSSAVVFRDSPLLRETSQRASSRDALAAPIAAGRRTRSKVSVAAPKPATITIFAVDLMRYWLHRAAHENATLWRLHAVHHSVEQLYWLNTARFHPLEKGLHMLLDSVPFLAGGGAGSMAS